MRARLPVPPVLAVLLVVAPCTAQTLPADRPGDTHSKLGEAHRPPHHHPRRHPAETQATPPVVAAPATPAARHVTPHPAAPARPAAHAPAPAAKPGANGPATPPATPPATLPATPAAPAADAGKGAVTGLPLPRWAALRTDDVNMRRGPGTRYPIEWVYKRRDLPVVIEREFEVWRLIHDAEGVKGWVHQATLVGHRSFVVTGTEAVMRRRPDETAEPVAKLKPGVVGRLRACESASAWCEVQVGDYRGYLPRDAFWGTNPGEAVGG